MKCKHILKRGLAITLTAAMIVVGCGVQTPNAGAKKAKQPKISKKKISATVGAQTTLSVSNAKKKVKWSTSNKKIVKISSTSGKKKSTATLVAVKKGKATITAKVGKKKLKCKVTVKASAISSLSFDPLDSTVVIMKLAKKTQLSATDLKVGFKEYQEGRFNQKPAIESLTTTDQKTYRLYLSRSVFNGDFVKVTYGKSEKTVQCKRTFKQDEDQTGGIIRKDAVVNLSLDYFMEGEIGDVVYTLKKGSKLPKGLVLAGKKGLIKGIPTEAGATTVALQAKDGLGRKANLSLTLKVYDEVTLAAADVKSDIRLDDYVADRNATVTGPAVSAKADPSDYYRTYEIKGYGGSENYKFAVADDGTGVKLTTDTVDVATGTVTQDTAKSTTLCIPYTIAAGEHNFAVTITDAADANRAVTVNVSVNAKQYVNISGTVKDNAGNPLSGHEAVYLIPADSDTFSDYISTVQWERMVKDSYGHYAAVAGNKVNGYSYYNTYTDEASDAVKYEIGTNKNTAQVGPYPTPTILHEEPTPGPTATTAPTADPASTAPAAYKRVELTDGAYQAEVPAGKYVVKVKAANKIKYEAVANMEVAADGTQDITMPTRFAKVTGTARYANDNPVINDYIYFEMTSGQYEGSIYSVQTNYAGAYVASLPAGEYAAYVLDEDQNSLYFANTLTVADGVDLSAADMKLSVSKSIVEGVLLQKISETETSRMANQRFYVYDAQGRCQSFRTNKEETVKDEATGEYKETDNSAIFKINLYDGVYNVRVRTNAGNMISVGTITVAGANIQGAARPNFVVDFGTYMDTAAEIALNTPVSAASTGNNNLLYKFTAPADGNYSFIISKWGRAVNTAPMAVSGKDENKMLSYYASFANTQTGEYHYGCMNLTAGQTYYIDLTPYTQSGNQEICAQNFRISNFQSYYDMYAAQITYGTPVSVKALADHPVEALNGKAVLKMNVTAGNGYTISADCTTIGAKSPSIAVISLSQGMFADNLNGNVVTVSSSNTSRTVRFTPEESGVCYVVLSTLNGQNATINATVNEAVVQTPPPAPTPTVAPSSTPDPSATPVASVKPSETPAAEQERR